MFLPALPPLFFSVKRKNFVLYVTCFWFFFPSLPFLDFAGFLAQFCKTQQKSGEEEEARLKAEMERKKRANAQITLLDPKTSTNVGIALAKIKLSNEKVQRPQFRSNNV